MLHANIQKYGGREKPEARFLASLFYTGYGIRNAAFFVCFRGVAESPISCGFGEGRK